MGVFYCRSYLEVLGAVPFVGVVAGYTGISGGSGTLATRVSDQPGDVGAFDTLLIHVTGIPVKPREEEIETVDVHVEIDLTELTGEASEFIDDGERDTESSAFLQVEAEAREATFGNGSSVTAEVSWETPLEFEAAFEIWRWETTTFIADFTPVKRGQTNECVLGPVADQVKAFDGTEAEA